MRSVCSSRLRGLALLVGILILAIGISVFIWPPQDDNGIGSVLRANDERPAGWVGPELTVGNDAALSDSAALDTERAGPSVSHGGPGDVANVLVFG